MARIVTFGELMLRLQPFNYERFVQAQSVEFTFGGGEANVAVSLANYGMDAAFVTKLPAHSIGQAAVNSLRRYGVDTSLIVRGGDSRTWSYRFPEDDKNRTSCPVSEYAGMEEIPAKISRKRMAHRITQIPKRFVRCF